MPLHISHFAILHCEYDFKNIKENFNRTIWPWNIPYIYERHNMKVRLW